MSSRVLGAFIDAVPGLHDLLQLGKIENAMNEPLEDEPKYDLTILDAPATGHGLSMLSAARTMRRMARVGPFADLARIIEVWLSDRAATAFVLVTLAGGLPVQECLHFVDQLGDDRHHLDTIVFNRLTRTGLPQTPSWSNVEAHLHAQDRPELSAIAVQIGAKVERATKELEQSELLISNLRERTHIRPRIAYVYQEESGESDVFDLAELGERP